MKVIIDVPTFTNSPLNVYIHCETAADLHKMEDKLLANKEYMTVWDDKCEEWFKKEWCKWYMRETMRGSGSVMIILSFHTNHDKFNDEFIKELSNYLSEGWSQDGAHFVKWQLFDKKD